MSLKSIDFARPRERVPRVGVAMLAVGLMALGVTAVCQQRWAEARALAQDESQRAAEALRVRQSARPVAAVPTRDERRLQSAAAERSRPWLATLRAVESATRDPVFLLSMDADVSNRSLRLESEAPSFDHALAYVQVLPDGIGLSSAHLLSHELATDASTGRQVVRFSVSAQWGAP